MNKVQKALLDALGLELEQEFDFEFWGNGETYRMKFIYDEDEGLKPMIKSENKWELCCIYRDLINNGEIHPIKKPILDDVEKKYLEAVLKPFKGEIEYIRIKEYNGDYTYLCAFFSNGDDFDFPKFKTGTMYKGMELYRRYTLEELGLFK